MANFYNMITEIEDENATNRANDSNFLQHENRK